VAVHVQQVGGEITRDKMKTPFLRGTGMPSQVLLAVVLFACSATCGAQQALVRRSPGQEPSVAVPKGEHRISFHARGDYILVRARVNGQRATLLLDTGAALSTFSIKILPTMDTDHRITMNLAKGSVSAFVVPAGFTLGDSDIKEQHCSFRRNIVVGDFKFGEADGVIGLDVLSSFKTVTFDFKDSVLVLEDR
jgi:hypothetical protein